MGINENSSEQLQVELPPVGTAQVEQPVLGKSADIMVPCGICREPIRQGAKKCIHCTSMLDWHGWLGISETALALLVALVSVIGATAPRLVELFTPQSSKLSLSIRQIYGQSLELVASNQGHQNSQLLSANIFAKTEGGHQLDVIPLQITGVPNVPGGQGTLFEMAIQPVAIPTFLNWLHPQIRSATLIILVNEYRKQPETRQIDVPLGYYRLLCRATEDSDTISRHPGQPSDSRGSTRCMSGVIPKQ
jgi:hypothetical protein